MSLLIKVLLVLTIDLSHIIILDGYIYEVNYFDSYLLSKIYLILSVVA